MRIARPLLDEIVEHARDEQPKECCGVIGVRDGRAVKVYRCRNEFRSPKYGFETGIDLFHAMEDMEEHGMELGAVYHSHPRTAAYPSQTDQNLSGQYPGIEWLIVGFPTPDPEIRAFRVSETAVEELDVEVE